MLQDASFLKCDGETTSRDDKGIVKILAGFAPLKPAEFVVIKIRQMAGIWKVPGRKRGGMCGGFECG
jgi:hypothetical protein